MTKPYLSLIGAVAFAACGDDAMLSDVGVGLDAPSVDSSAQDVGVDLDSSLPDAQLSDVPGDDASEALDANVLPDAAEILDAGADAALRCRDGVLFSDDFESGGLRSSENGFEWTSPNNTAVVDSRARNGTRSLAFTYGATPNGEDSISEQRFFLGGNYDDVWIQYSIHIPANYDHRSQDESTNNKGFLYLWSDDYGSPSGPGLGPNFWPNGDGTSNASFYRWGPGLDEHDWDGMPNAIVREDIGQWVELTIHYRYATSAGNDGVAEIWKRRGGTLEKIYDVQDGAWFVDGQPGFDRGYLLGWSNSGFDEDTTFHIDDFTFSTQPLIGCDD